MSRQQLSLFCSAPRDRAVIQVIYVKTFKTATILFIDSVTISMASVTLLLTIVDMYMLSGCELIDTENISVSSQN
jgi:hypothetical protein